MCDSYSHTVQKRYNKCGKILKMVNLGEVQMGVFVLFLQLISLELFQNT